MRVGLLLALLFVLGCEQTSDAPVSARPASEQLAEAPVVKPPFSVRGEAEGLLLIWYDDNGAPQTAHKLSDVPQTQRARVRVDSLEVAPDQRLDPAFVYVADLTHAEADGSYVVRMVSREVLEAAVQPAKLAEAANDDVIIYGASWCGACKSAAKYLTQKGVAFTEKDIEKEPGAREEMLAKASAQHVNASGIPVLDVKGKMLGGFDPRAVDRALAQ